MTEPVTCVVEGVELVLCRVDSWQRKQEGHQDLWMPHLEWDGPSDPSPISDWPDIIKKWQVAKQVEAGFEVWNLSDDRPKYWGKHPAVFRRGGLPSSGSWNATVKQIETRNGSDPKSLYAIDLRHCAPITPEVEAAIEHARGLHQAAIDAAIDAAQAWKEAWKAIPRLSEADWLKLPVSPREDR